MHKDRLIRYFQLTYLLSLVAILITAFAFIFAESKPEPETLPGCIVVGTGARLGSDAGGGNNEHGKELFNQNCRQCHSLSQVIVGPALQNVRERRSDEWLHRFILNSQNVIKEGDPYAINLFEKYSGTVMPPFSHLSRSDIDSLLQYIDP